MEESRNTHSLANTVINLSLKQNYNFEQAGFINSLGSNGDEDNDKLSPRSLEHLNNIKSGISQLVDDFSSPQQDDRQIQEQMQNISIGARLQYNMAADPNFNKDQINQQAYQISGGDISGGTPFFPSYNLENQEKIQGMIQGVGDFQNPVIFTRGNLSRHSSDGDGLMNQNKAKLDYSSIAVFEGPLSGNKHEENYSSKSWIDSSSDYQEQIEKFGYIFQSPDLNAQRNMNIMNMKHHQQQQQQQQMLGGQGQQQFQGMGGFYHNGMQQNWEGYHQNMKPTHNFQNRASSFDKLAQQNQAQHPFGYSEELETHSAASSGGQSAFSEGDIYNQMNAQYYAQYQGYAGQTGAQSNQAQYGFTPNIQFSNSNQKFQQNINPGFTIPFQPDGGYFQGQDIQDDLTPGGGNVNNGDIQITDLDVNLQKFQIGVSPRRNSNEFIPSKKLLASGPNNHLNFEQLDKSHSALHNQYKTPSPYRNSYTMNADPTNQYSQAFMINQNANGGNKNIRIGPPNMSDPFYPSYGFQNQRMSNPNQGAYPGKPIYPVQRTSNVDQYTGNQHIGMNAPPMTRNLQFAPQESHIHHGGPMIAIQTNMHQGFHPGMQFQNMGMPPGYHHHTLRNQFGTKTAGSQERDPSYQPPNFVQNQHTVQPKTVVNTPTHNTSLEHAKSVSSQNSNNSQQFSSAVNDQNEAFLFQLTKQYDECQNPQQKLDIIKGNVHKLALTQKGSRFLQKQVTKANSSIVAFFLDEISPHLCELMIDNYGNYFCQSLLSSCSGDQRLSILRSIQPKFIEICCDRKGTHTIQTMFELVNLPEEEDFIRDALMGNVIKLSKDAQGTHVIQKVMASFPETKRAFIFEEVFDQFIDLAKNTNGLCVVKKLVQYTKNSDQADILMKKIQENAIDLVQDPFGNYAVTEVIIKWEPEVCRPIYDTLRQRISQLSSQKFSSNVIEKCLEKADEFMRSAFIQELSFSDRLTSLIRNQYGNYVVQKALKLAQGGDKDTLIAQIQRCIPEITDKKIREKWEKIIFDAQNGTNTANQSNVNDNTSTGSYHQDHEGNHNLNTSVGNNSHRQVTVGNRRANSSDNAAN